MSIDKYVYQNLPKYFALTLRIVIPIFDRGRAPVKSAHNPSQGRDVLISYSFTHET